MARTYRISLWDNRHESKENALGHTIDREEPFDWLPVPDTFAFTFKDSYDSLWDAKLRRADDLAHAEMEIAYALSE